MHKNRTSTFHYRTIHPSLLPSPVLNTAVATDCFQQVDNSHQQTCHCHSFTDNNQHQNNHNSDLIQYDEVSKSRNDIPHRKRRYEYDYRSNKKFSLLPIYINNTLLILIHLMILFIIVLIISLTFYYPILYIYSKPKKNRWEQIIHWFYQE